MFAILLISGGTHMTIRQIADSFGVAPSTVSVVLNNKPGVRRELRQQIRLALIENGYQVREGENACQGNILFIYFKSSDYLAARKDDTITSMLSGIEEVCEKRKFTFSVANATFETIDKVLMSVSPNTYKGVLLLGTEYYQEPRDTFYELPVPLVIVDGFFPECPLNTVNLDNSYGIHQALQYLLENGHTKIDYIKSALEYGCLRDRAACVQSSLSRLGLQMHSNSFLVSQKADLIQTEMYEYLRSCSDMPSAFIADNDIIAVSTIQVLQNMGYRVPEDISIIGFDDSSVCTILTPHLTTVRADFTGMANLAASRLIDMIESGQRTIIKSTVGSTLIKRQSVAPYSKCRR